MFDRRSGRRVLTSEYVEGLEFNRFAERASQPERDHAATVIFRTAYGSIMRHCVYNADPHPGNYLFDAQGRVWFLDFGCVKRFDAAFIERWKAVARAVLADDRPRFKETLLATGLVARPRRFDFGYQWEVFQYLYQPFLSQTPFTYTHDYVRRSYDLLLFNNPNTLRSALPPDWLFVNRLQWGLNSVLAHLTATGPWPELWRRAIESPTVPAWSAAHPRPQIAELE